MDTNTPDGLDLEAFRKKMEAQGNAFHNALQKAYTNELKHPHKRSLLQRLNSWLYKKKHEGEWIEENGIERMLPVPRWRYHLIEVVEFFGVVLFFLGLHLSMMLMGIVVYGVWELFSAIGRRGSGGW